MLFHTTFKNKSGYTEEDRKRVLGLWSKWQPPEGMEIKAFYMGVDGRGFLITEAKTAEAIFEAVAPWVGVLLDYDIVPIVEVGKAVELFQQTIAFTES
jgi:hypothetical protein